MFEETSLQAAKSEREGILPRENTVELYDEMTSILQDIIDLNMNSNNVYKFLRNKGLDRVVAPCLHISYTPLRRLLLILTKQLFDIAPTTAKVAIPISVVDSLLEILEKDDNVAIKAYVIDILYLWLPGNVKVQVRVMKLKGLDMFYNQIKNLDFTAIHTLLNLFNKILEEHIEVKSGYAQKTKENTEDLVLYQRIGLLERMSTAHVCNGLLNIFETSLPLLSKTDQIMPPIFELVKMIKPFCLKFFKGKSKPLEIFEKLFKLLEDKRSVKFEELHKINMTDIHEVLDQYVQELKSAISKDEL
ncbi:unnamed protein product [Parnassius apollo]|uniref:(apollo) hypothetical protein n=1 Tax=Parnassius apollo TaxID=110799 RepID=A0A8S3XB52_PARAO|nr:unnamed protein product [Parnassius apollo]